MVDLGGNNSSLWVATGTASALGKTLRSTVHVLAIGNDNLEIVSVAEGTELDVPLGSYILEDLPDPTLTPESGSVFKDRLSDIRADGRIAIVHISQFREQAINLPHTDLIDGVVLLVRAEETRRAALEAIERHLALVRTPLLGSVLLDRVCPIPEKLYRLL
jgi:hypothetical protein